MRFITLWAQKLLRVADALEWLPPLLIRLFVGYMFFELGWAKLHNLAAFTQRFIAGGASRIRPSARRCRRTPNVSAER